MQAIYELTRPFKGDQTLAQLLVDEQTAGEAVAAINSRLHSM